MSRAWMVVVVVCAAILGGFVATAINSPGVDEARVRALVADAIAAQPRPTLDSSAIEAMVQKALAAQPATMQSAPTLDAAELNPMIEDYLLKNPRILQKVSAALDAEVAAAKKQETADALASEKAAIYDDPDHIVLGNPNGDVTLVEMFDYNCMYCRQAMPDIQALLDEDKNLKLILKEFPILSAGSVDAARVAVLVSENKDVDYWKFHTALYTSRGQVTKDTALAAAKDLGLNPITLELNMGTPKVTAVLDKSYDLAKQLKVTGTPTFILGDEIIPGAVGIDALKQRIANLRACGSTQCPDPAPAANNG